MKLPFLSVHYTRLRIGTFNVNGKLPSQDLSAWVRGISIADANKYIPPLKQLSPFSIGDITKDPLDTANSLVTASLSSSHVHLTAFSAAQVHTDSGATPDAPDAPELPASEPPSNQDDEDDDADLIVLGFQELDLSTSALLYSTETTREDAWLTAVLAGLGEKAAAYEKVSARFRDACFASHSCFLTQAGALQLASRQLVGMLVLILVKRTLRDCFARVQAASVGAGLMGLMVRPRSLR